MTVRILCTSLMQTQKPTGTTTPNLRDTLKSLSATNNLALTGTMTNPSSGSCSTFGTKTTRVHMSHTYESSPSKNVGPNTTNTLLRPLRSRNSLPSSPLLPRQPPTHLGFPPSNSLKPILASQPHHSVSDVIVGHTHIRKPLQHLFKLYPKPTPHPYPYPRLCLRNSYYTIKSMFDISINPMLYHQHKLTFWHHHNKLHHCTTSINIS